MINVAKAKRFIKNAISFIIIAGLGYYLWQNWDAFYAVFDASWYHIVGLILCVFATWTINCLQNHMLLRQVGIRIKFWENMILQTAMVLGNHLPMRLGSLIRMRYFKKVYGLQYTKFAGIAWARTLILLIATAILGCIGLAGLNLSETSLIWILILLLSAIVAMAFGLRVVLVSKKGESNKPTLKKFGEFMAAWETIQSHPILFWQISGLVILQFITFCLRLSISFDTIDIALSPWILLIMVPTTRLISFLSLTPGNLGLREGMFGAISFASGYDFHDGIFAGALDRAVLLACAIIFGSVPLAYVWIKSMHYYPSSLTGNGSFE
jgi:uncharacterized membrane protein YbhN (UPF0104 family)